MAKKQTSPLKLIRALGTSLYDIRKEITEIEEANKLRLDPLRKRKEEIQIQLIQAFRDASLTSIKVPSGEAITLASRAAYIVINPFHALIWAKEHGAVKIDSIMLKQKLEKQDPASLPVGVFAPVVEEYISVRKPKPPKTAEAAN